MSTVRVYGKTRGQRRRCCRCSRTAPVRCSRAGTPGTRRRASPRPGTASSATASPARGRQSPKLSGQRQQQPEHDQHDARLEQEEVRAVDEHRAQVDPARPPTGENQPERLWWLRRPSRSLRKRTGTSAVRSSMCTDFSTISDAYSQDCERRSMRSSASRGDAAHAAVDVREAAAEDDVQDPGRDRRARGSGAAAASSRARCSPRKREPMTNSSPSRNFSTNGRQLAEVVGAVAVAHEDVAPADERQRVDVRAAEAALGRPQHARAARQRELRRAVVASCRRSGSRRRRRPPAGPAWHQATKSAIVSSSLSAGMTIDSSGSATSFSEQRGGRPGRESGH